MKLTKLISILLVAVLAIAAFAMAASADGTVSVAGATYKVTSPKSIELTGDGVTASYRGNGSIDVLMDGDIARSVTNHDQKGIVLVLNDYVVARPAVPVVQDLSEIPVASFVLDFGSEVSFDTAYMGIFWQQAGIGEPANNNVVIETSKDGKVWSPVGKDGQYYFSMPACPDWVEGLPNSDQGIPYVAEVAIPLGETVKSRYVRYSYTFPVLPKDFHWTYYTNVYEFIGFTELGVANYQNGRKAKQLKAEDVKNRPAIEGEWYVSDGGELSVFNFKDEKGELECTLTVYDEEDYLANGADAEGVTLKGTYFIEGDKLITFFDGEYDEYEVSVDGDGVISLGGVALLSKEDYGASNPGANPGETSGDTSGDTSDETPSEDTSSDETPSEATSSTAASSVAGTSSTASASKTPSTAASSTGTTEEGGLSTGVIVAIVVAVVVVIAVVVSIIVGMRKKKA